MERFTSHYAPKGAQEYLGGRQVYKHLTHDRGEDCFRNLARRCVLSLADAVLEDFPIDLLSRFQHPVQRKTFTSGAPGIITQAVSFFLIG